MSVVVVTRLRVKDPSLTNDFFTGAVSILEQVKISPGSLGSDVLADAQNTWWTVSVWQERTAMRAFVGREPHLSVMARLDDWCDEATFVDWEQDDDTIPDWPTCYQHIVADGAAATLTGPSPENATRSFPPPVDISK